MWTKKQRQAIDDLAQATSDLAGAVGQNTAAVAAARSRKPIGGILAGIAAFAAVGSAIFTGAQAWSLASQLEQSNAMVDAQTLGAVSVAGEGATISIMNRSSIPFETVGVWVIADDEKNHILEVLGDAVGLPSCSTLEIDLSEQLGPSTIAEAMTAIQLPSDAWHLISAGGRTEPIDYVGSDATAAMRNSEFYVSSADAYWEGADGSDEVVLEDQIVANAPRTGWSPAEAELIMSECAG
ncbi:hypothetical protein [uncultured Microbacterium sp.]|uniref:hypothetical protein n=1 Tax=uncultured Microbacterium sp. TaxID=191216 RepID=UPI0025CF0FCC|nr:hypothetical protein [uncultured Microbacterium sp.]